MQRPNSSTVLVTVAFLVLPVYRGVAIGQESPGPATPAVSTAKPSESAVQLPEGVDDILKLSRGKVHEDVTLAFVEGSGRRFNLTASQILELHKEGVSDRVLAAMLRGSSIPAPEGPQAPLPPAPATSPAPSSEASVSAAQPAASSATEEPTYVATASAPNSFASSYPYSYAYPYYSYGYPYYSYAYPYYSCGYGWPWFSLGFYFGGGCGYYGRYYYCGKGYYGKCYYGGNSSLHVTGSQGSGNATGNPANGNNAGVSLGESSVGNSPVSGSRAGGSLSGLAKA